MKSGDLVKVIAPEHIPGALTAVKFFHRLLSETEGKVGIVIDGLGGEGQTTFLVQFPNFRKVIHRQHLEVISGAR